jgi:hypothetical protein
MHERSEGQTILMGFGLKSVETPPRTNGQLLNRVAARYSYMSRIRATPRNPLRNLRLRGSKFEVQRKLSTDLNVSSSVSLKRPKCRPVHQQVRCGWLSRRGCSPGFLRYYYTNMTMVALRRTSDKESSLNSGGRHHNPVVVSNATVAKQNLDFDSVWIRHCVTFNASADRMRNANFVYVSSRYLSTIFEWPSENFSVRSQQAIGFVLNTLKAFANSSPGLLQPWDYCKKNCNAESVGEWLRRPLRGGTQNPRLQQPWAGISQRSQRKSIQWCSSLIA